MSYSDKILTSIHGRRLGLQNITAALFGITRQPFEVLVGPEAVRENVSTGESTAANLPSFGVSRAFGTSVASTPVYTLDPPVPGIRKTVQFASTDSAIYVKASAGVAIAGTSLGTTGATVARSSGGGAIELMGLTTALWLTLTQSSTAVNGVGLQATT